MGSYLVPTYHFLTEAELLEYILSLWVYVGLLLQSNAVFLQFSLDVCMNKNK